MVALSLEHVSHAYGALVAVDDVSLSVGEGELVCLIGPSGCGKTTALRIAAGLEPLQSGRVLMAGRIVADETMDLAPEQRSVGLVFQDYALFPHLSVIDNVTFGLRGHPRGEREARGLEVLSQVGLAEAARSFPHTLSGGQQQRVALARALAPRPRVMLLDEPFSGLDAQLRRQVRDDTLHVLKNSGAGTLMVTHDPEEAMFMADRIALMHGGRLIQVGAPTDLYCAPVDGFAAGFFGEVNRIEGVVRQGRVSTPFGTVAAPGLAEGTAVEVLIRPEALHLRPAGASGANGPAAETGRARVMAARMLGRTSLVHLCVDDGSGQALHCHARVPGQFLPAEDAPVSVDLARGQTFVFPLSEPK